MTPNELAASPIGRAMQLNAALRCVRLLPNLNGRALRIRALFRANPNGTYTPKMIVEPTQHMVR